MELDWTRVIVPMAKLSSYLLALDHPEGGPKAVFFHRCGFRPDAPGVLARALIAHGRSCPAVSQSTPFGVKYVVDGPFAGADGRVRQLRSIWIVDELGGPLRFVSAYPLELRDGA